MAVIYDLNSDWSFARLPQADGSASLAVHKSDFDDTLWERVTLPHTWNDKDGASGRTGICQGGENYYRGLACYRRRFVCDCSDKRVFIEFGAANTIAEVFVNSEFVGRHEGGYSAFRFDITDFVSEGENVIAVKVDNSPTNYIAPITDQGDFTKMGGLYREVKLIVTENVHIDLLDYGSSGVYITPKNITADNVQADILVKLSNDGDTERTLTVIAEILDAAGTAVAVAREDITLSADSKTSVALNTDITAPVLWNGRKCPYLYTAKVTLSEGGNVLDSRAQTFGIRTYHIDREQGFFLNGQYLDLHGVNYHQDSYENGWAMTDEQRERDYKMMLDMGCTSVRMAHYQHCQHEYDICDRYGIT